MSQHSTKPPSECSSPSKAPPADKEPRPVYGTASSRLKGLMRKSKLQNHSITPYSRRGHSQDRPPESPRSAHSATPPSAPTTAEAVSCADRLKAVANMVKIRSSPAPSPKPSVACSQLALLLSSEAHLQQYSREHALKAQLSGRSASERLAAMANQQLGPDQRPPSGGKSAQYPRYTKTHYNAKWNDGNNHNDNNTPTDGPVQSSGPLFAAQTPREKRGFDSRPTRPPQTCSSLLLLLLNNHNNQKQLTKNGHLEDSCGILPASGSSSVTSDSECSIQERNKLTESLLNKWKPDPSGPNVCKNKEPEMSPDLKSHSKVTLMQLLLERRNNEMGKKNKGNPELPLDITMATMSRGQPTGLVAWEETRTKSPLDRSEAPAQSLYSLNRDPKPAFSASKLLQNLAQCGTASSSPPIPSSKGLVQEHDASRPLALLERLNAPINRTTTTPFSDGPSGSGTPYSQKEASPPSSQIENLLERRTVLQLLLGTGSSTATVSRKDRSGGSGRRSVEVSGGCYEKSPGAPLTYDSSNGTPWT
ncbi:hypothetical protein NQZ68_039764 [Dissostichus eleginoides]|nr:hypothetical protein NQZ68_039764 [Dissostichus eleginoides]